MDEAGFNALADAELGRLEGLLDACREIWLAAKSGGFHFRPADGRWVGTRDGEDFYVVLSRCMSEQAGEPVSLKG